MVGVKASRQCERSERISDSDSESFAKVVFDVDRGAPNANELPWQPVSIKREVSDQ